MAPLSGTSPIRPKARTKLAPSAAMRRSQAKASDGPGPGGDPVDGREHRLGQPAHREDDRVVALADLDVERCRVRREPLPEVLAGAERAARAGEDDGADGGIALRLAEDREELALEGRIVSALSASGRSSVIVATPSRDLDAAEGAEDSARHQPANATSSPSTSSKIRRSIGSSAPSLMLDDEVGEEDGELVVARVERAGQQQVAIRQPDEDPAPRAPSSAASRRRTSGSRIRAASQPVARVGAQEPTVARDLVAPCGAGGPGGQVRQGGIMDRRPPRRPTTGGARR